ncbi:MAG: YjjG family noncanonical pyrimidine nucleotidase [Clostridiales bacterium]|nr:YjjG family noncanonical pyrimidine nucleotidase [Clostridiales bacterium]
MNQDNKNILHAGIAWIDLDDTLWDFKANSRIALSGLYRDYQLSQWFDTVEHWIACYERHNHALWDLYNHAAISKDFLMTERFKRPLLEASCDKAVELGQQFDHEYLDRLAQCTQLVDGAIELLIRLRQRGWKIGILSNGFTEVQHRKVNNSGLAPYVDYVVLSDEIGVNKPDVRLYRHAEQTASTQPDKCLMVGDNPDTDITGALAAGWQAIYFTRGNDDCPIAGVPTVRTLADIMPLVSR